MKASGKQALRRQVAKIDKVDKVNKSPIKQIAAIIQTLSIREAESNAKENMSDEILQMANQPPIKTPICYSINQIEVLQKLGNLTFAAHYETDKFLQKVIQYIKKPDSTKINRLPTPWRKKFRCLSLDESNFMYMDERLVIPKTLRPIVTRSLHYGHPGSDSILATVSNVWWPRLHREVVTIGRQCRQCRESGKNIKTLLTQKQVGKLPECKKSNREIAIDFAGLFQNAINARKTLLMPVYLCSGWPGAKYLRKPTTGKVNEFVKIISQDMEFPQKLERTQPL